MRIVHTSDWHAGRVWRRKDRLDELEAALDHLAGFIEREQIDLVLHSGDVFEHGNPPPEAERAVFRFFRRIGTQGTRTVLIAGNHDHPTRLEAWSTLSDLVGVHIGAHPRSLRDGGLVRLPVRCGQTACVAALPFAPAHRHFQALQLHEDESVVRQAYAAAMQRMMENLAGGFEPGCVNLLMAHTHVQGAEIAGSERKVHLGEDWAATPQAVPPQAQYVALGHIHRPQGVPGHATACYAGSVLQLDFGELDEEKGFVLIEAHPGKPVHMQRVPYEGGRRLVEWKGTWAELEEAAPRLSGCWARLILQLDGREEDVSHRARRLVPDALEVKAVWPRSEPEEAEKLPAGASPVDLYKLFCHRRDGTEPGAELLETFEQLREASEREAAPQPRVPASRGKKKK